MRTVCGAETVTTPALPEGMFAVYSTSDLDVILYKEDVWTRYLHLLCYENLTPDARDDLRAQEVNSMLGRRTKSQSVASWCPAFGLNTNMT